ncbi:oxygenase MpaB family protein [Frigoribacterium sp. 2-23]|uniref:oxygenase MpaB family protein n=1 Tax=Frigoribacterium sp. 2-23 TaxID=3415006 RepID=UPI003C6FD7C3
MASRAVPGASAAPPSLPVLSAADEALFGRFRLAVLTDLGPDFRLGFKLAYFSNFASPAIAAPLDASGQIASEPMRRAKDTSIVVYEIVTNGFDSERGRRMVDLLRRVHRGVPGSRDDYLYVLETLFVAPLRLVRRTAPRSLDAHELAQAAAFFGRLGAELGLDGVPATLAEAERFCTAYEAAHAEPSAAGARLMASTLGALVESAPRRVRPAVTLVARLGVSALFDDPVMSRALGLPVLPRFVRRAVAAGVRLRRRAAVRRAARGSAGVEFTSGEASRVYPGGYALDDIGPRR